MIRRNLLFNVQVVLGHPGRLTRISRSVLSNLHVVFEDPSKDMPGGLQKFVDYARKGAYKEVRKRQVKETEGTSSTQLTMLYRIQIRFKNITKVIFVVATLAKFRDRRFKESV